MTNAAELVVVDPDEVDSRLFSLGLSREILREAIRAGMVERAGCTPLDPKSHPGTVLWGRGIRVLRERLIALGEGWRPDDDRGLPLVVHPVRRLAITISSATKQVGNGTAANPPRNRNHKGVACADLVEVNSQAVLFPENPQFVRTPKKAERTTWILLICAENDSSARCELSLPKTISDGWITSWSERIMLETVRLDEEPVAQPEAPSADPTIRVTVTPKVAVQG